MNKRDHSSILENTDDSPVSMKKGKHFHDPYHINEWVDTYKTYIASSNVNVGTVFGFLTNTLIHLRNMEQKRNPKNEKKKEMKGNEVIVGPSNEKKQEMKKDLCDDRRNEKKEEVKEKIPGNLVDMPTFDLSQGSGSSRHWILSQ